MTKYSFILTKELGIQDFDIYPNQYEDLSTIPRIGETIVFKGKNNLKESYIINSIEYVVDDDSGKINDVNIFLIKL